MRVKEIQAEIQLLQSVSHPNIAKYYGSGLEPRIFIVMEVRGRTQDLLFALACELMVNMVVLFLQILEGGSLNQRLGFAPKYSSEYG